MPIEPTPVNRALTASPPHAHAVPTRGGIVYGFPEGSSPKDLATKAAMRKMGELTKDLIYNSFDHLAQRAENDERIYGLYSTDDGQQFLIERNAQYQTPTMGVSTGPVKGECTELALTGLRRLKSRPSLSDLQFSIVRGKAPIYFGGEESAHYSILTKFDKDPIESSTIPPNAVLFDPSFKTVLTGAKATESGYTLGSIVHDLVQVDREYGLTGPGASGNRLENCWTIQKVDAPPVRLPKVQVLGYLKDIIPGHPGDGQDLLNLSFGSTSNTEHPIRPLIGTIDRESQYRRFNIPDTESAEALKRFVENITKQANTSMPEFDSYLQRHPELDVKSGMADLPVATLYESSMPRQS